MSETTQTFVVFGIGDARLALPVDEVGEVVPVARLVDVPGTSRWLLGLLHLRGESVPVVDIAVRLGVDAAPAGLDARIVVAGHGPGRVGLLADNDVQLVSVTADAVRLPSRVEALGGSARAVAEVQSGPVVILDLDAVVGDRVRGEVVS